MLWCLATGFRLSDFVAATWEPIVRDIADYTNISANCHHTDCIVQKRRKDFFAEDRRVTFITARLTSECD